MNINQPRCVYSQRCEAYYYKVQKPDGRGKLGMFRGKPRRRHLESLFLALYTHFKTTILRIGQTWDVPRYFF